MILVSKYAILASVMICMVCAGPVEFGARQGPLRRQSRQFSNFRGYERVTPSIPFPPPTTTTTTTTPPPPPPPPSTPAPSYLPAIEPDLTGDGNLGLPVATLPPTVRAPPPPTQAPEEHHHHHEHEHHDPYVYGYEVADNEHGTYFSRGAKSDGGVENGMYSVLLPDGREMVVTYVADWKDGFTARVQYNDAKQRNIDVRKN